MRDPMIKLEPNSLDALVRELLVERYLTTDRDRRHGNAVVDNPEAFTTRQRVLCEALDEPAADATSGEVVPLRRSRRRAA